MRLTLLGTGTPTPNPERQGSANLLEVGGQYLLLQCCYLADAEIDSHDRQVLSTYVLGSAAQAGRTAARAAVKKLVLTHLAPKSAAMLAEVEADARRNFAGEVVVGADLMTLEV